MVEATDEYLTPAEVEELTGLKYPLEPEDKDEDPTDEEAEEAVDGEHG